MAANRPRAVFVTRETDYELLIAHHATRGQARFFLETRGQRLEDVEARHDRFHAVLGTARASVPADWRQTLVSRADLNRFLFARRRHCRRRAGRAGRQRRQISQRPAGPRRQSGAGSL